MLNYFRTPFNLVTEVSVSTLARMSVVQWGKWRVNRDWGTFGGFCCRAQEAQVDEGGMSFLLGNCPLIYICFLDTLEIFSFPVCNLKDESNLKRMSTKPRFLINIERNIRRGVAQRKAREGRIEV